VMFESSTGGDRIGLLSWGLSHASIHGRKKISQTEGLSLSRVLYPLVNDCSFGQRVQKIV
jgi:hypothetical protein